MEKEPKYAPSSEEVKKAEEMMTEREGKKSEDKKETKEWWGIHETKTFEKGEKMNIAIMKNVFKRGGDGPLGSGHVQIHEGIQFVECSFHPNDMVGTVFNQNGELLHSRKYDSSIPKKGEIIEVEVSRNKFGFFKIGSMEKGHEMPEAAKSLEDSKNEKINEK